jgi:hypothetical protein
MQIRITRHSREGGNPVDILGSHYMKSTRNDNQFWIPAFAGMTEGYALARYGTRETEAMSIIA